MKNEDKQTEKKSNKKNKSWFYRVLDIITFLFFHSK